MKNRANVAFSGVVTALSVVLLSLGSFIWIFSYVTPILTGLFIAVIDDLFGRKNAVLTYVSTGLISLMLLNDKESVLLYILFFGLYPFFRLGLEGVKPKALSTLFKYAFYNVSVIVTEIICVYLFMIPLDIVFGKWGILILLILVNVLFFVYDKMYGVLLILYHNKLKAKIIRLIK